MTHTAIEIAGVAKRFDKNQVIMCTCHGLGQVLICIVGMCGILIREAPAGGVGGYEMAPRLTREQCEAERTAVL